MTVSHLRFGDQPIRSSYLISRASFVACHQFSFLERIDVLQCAEPGATFLLNSPYSEDEVWEHLPLAIQRKIIDNQLRFFVIDAVRVARECGMGGRINTVMQTCFFALSGALPREEAIEQIKQAIEKTYGKRGEAVVREELTPPWIMRSRRCFEVKVPAVADSRFDRAAAGFVRRSRVRARRAGPHDRRRRRPVAGQRIAGRRNLSHRHVEWEKRNLTLEIPVWEQESVHPVRQVRGDLPALGDPREGGGTGTAGQSAGQPEISGGALERAASTCATFCRLRRKIAPAAACASKFARPRARRRARRRPSICSFRRPFADARNATGSSSMRCPNSTARRWLITT